MNPRRAVRPDRLDPEAILAALDAFADVRLLVVGDLVLDEYLWGDVDQLNTKKLWEWMAKKEKKRKGVRFI